MAGIHPNDPVVPIADELRRFRDDALVAGRSEPPVVDYQPGSVACLERDASGRWALAAAGARQRMRAFTEILWTFPRSSVICASAVRLPAEPPLLKL